VLLVDDGLLFLRNDEYAQDNTLSEALKICNVLKVR
jgi:hypothetical protein